MGAGQVLGTSQVPKKVRLPMLPKAPFCSFFRRTFDGYVFFCIYIYEGMVKLISASSLVEDLESPGMQDLFQG